MCVTIAIKELFIFDPFSGKVPYLAAVASAVFSSTSIGYKSELQKLMNSGIKK